MCIVIKSWKCAWVFLSIQIGFPFTWRPNLIFLKATNCFPVAPCTSTINLCVFPIFSSILFNQDGPTIQLHMLYLVSVTLTSLGPLWFPPGRKVTILAVTGLAAALGVSWFHDFDQHPNPRNERICRPHYLRYQENSSPDFWLAHQKIFRHYEEGKTPWIINASLVNRDIYIYICTPTVEVHL